MFGDGVCRFGVLFSLVSVLSYDPEEHVVYTFNKEYILFSTVGLEL